MGTKSRETLEKNIENARADPAKVCLLGDDLKGFNLGSGTQ